MNSSLSVSGLVATNNNNSPNKSWCSPVLGESFRNPRCLSKNPFLANLKKSIRLPKAPRPVRAMQIFHGIKKGIKECIEKTEEDMVRLKDTEDVLMSSTTSQSRAIEVEKHFKLAERYKKRLECHLTKIEELEESYVLHQQLREGVKAMAKAYISHSGSSKKTSMHYVECGFKECTEILCIIEAQLESLLGSFDCILKGLVGFARLLPGDVFEIVLHYGLQKWKSKGKIGTTSQTWEPQNVKLKALLGDVFCIKATEVKMLGKHVSLGEKNCETVDLFSVHPRELVINLNASGSIKLGTVFRWHPLDGVDESMYVVDVARQFRPSPRRQLPVQSMIEGDGQIEYWSRMYGDSPLPDNSTRATNRYSMPCFSPSFNALSLDLIQGKNVQSDVRNSSSTSDFRRDQTPVHAVHRPRSMFVSDVSSDPVIRRPRPMSSGTMDVIVEHTPHKVLKQMDFKNAAGWQPSHELPSYADLSVEDIILKIQTMIDTLGKKHECLCVLKREITAIKQLFQKSSGAGLTRRGSDVSISVESALEAFNFLDVEDYTSDVGEQNQLSTEEQNDLDRLEMNCTLSPESTAKTTDSGIESLANRLSEERAGDFRSSLALSSTGNDQVDVALAYHLRYCANLLHDVIEIYTGSFWCYKEKRCIDKLVHQVNIVGKLVKIAKTAGQEPELPEVLSSVTSSEASKQFWLRCVDQHLLYTSSNSVAHQLGIMFHQMQTVECKLSSEKVTSLILSRILDSVSFNKTWRPSFDVVTLHQFMNYFTTENNILTCLQKTAEEVFLCEQLQSNNADIVGKAIKSFSSTVPPLNCLYEVAYLLQSRNADVQRLAAAYLSEMSANPAASEIVRIYRESLESSDSKLRCAACKAIEQLQERDAMEQLSNLMKYDQSLRVRHQAEKTLAAFGQVQAHHWTKFSNAAASAEPAYAAFHLDL